LSYLYYRLATHLIPDPILLAPRPRSPRPEPRSPRSQTPSPLFPDPVPLVPRPRFLIFIAWQPGYANTEMTTPDPDFTSSDAQSGYGKHMASSLPSILFPILVFALEHENLRISITQLTKALNLENLVFDNFDPKKSIKHKIIILLKCIERYFTHIAKSKNAKIGDL
jgi:hypothetical protein